MSRINCPQCQRPEKLCFCDSIITVANETPVSIIQHPSETEHPFNTARIAELALQQCQLITAESLSEEQLSKFTTAGTALLYPNLSWLPASSPLPTKIKQLVVIDGNWKKSKKILHLNPALQQLPRLSLSNIPDSNYQIRKSQQTDGLATIEAIYHALSMLEPTDIAGLLQPFETMITRQLDEAKRRTDIS